MLKNLFVIIGAISICGMSIAAEKPGNIVKNGNFATGTLAGWKNANNAKVFSVSGKPTLLLGGSYSSVTQDIPLKSNWMQLHLSMKMKASKVSQGNAGWKNGRMAMVFKNASGQRVGKWPNVFFIKGSTGWVKCERDYTIPPGATTLEIKPANFGKSGNLEFRDISITVTKTRQPIKDLPLPEGAADVWSKSKGWRIKSQTQEKICINGLWRFIPEISGGTKIPANGKGWGWFKVPGIWPKGKAWDTGTAAQEFLLPAGIKGKTDFNKLEQAWYKRDIHIPASWKGKQIILDFEMVQTHCAIYIDGKPAGEIVFPGGEVDITSAVKPGKKAVLTILHTARPLQKASDVFMAPGRAFKSKATLKMKGITGNVYLVARPEKNYITDTHVITSTRKNKITFDSGITKLQNGNFQVSAEVFKDNKLVKTFTSKPFTKNNLTDGRFKFSADWANPELWDTHTPDNIYTANITLKKANGTVVDQQLPFEFGFREFWIEGRDFYLNGKRIHLRALYVRNISDFADQASFAGSMNTCKKMKEYGFNYLITNNYNFSPGSVGYMNGLFNATRKTGVLASFSLPHGKDYNWQLDTAGQSKRYKKLAQWLIRKIQNNPSIITYAMNHNATGYYGDQNPLKMDGRYSLNKIADVPESKLKYLRQAAIAENIAKDIDPSRAVYHHQSGNLGDIYTVNFYLNWAPRQERSDWMEHWSKNGTKPIFFVEWGLPHIASWSSYRGPFFIWRTRAFQMIWDSEFASAITNQKAFVMTKHKQYMQTKENSLLEKNKTPHWGVHLAYLLKGFEQNYLKIQSWFAEDNWRSFRMKGVSAMLPWDQAGLWKRVAKTKQKLNPARYANLQTPDIVPDYFGAGSQYIYDRQKNSFEATTLGKIFLRWNKPVIAFIAGKKSHATEKSKNFTAGQIIDKQLVIVNDSRKKITCNYSWALSGLNSKAKGSIDVAPGDVVFVPVKAKVSGNAKPGEYILTAEFKFAENKIQTDKFALNVIAKTAGTTGMKRTGKIALFDPIGTTEKLLNKAGITFAKVDNNADLSNYKMLIIGKNALAQNNSQIDLSKVNHKMNILVFEQPYKVLTNCFGFRANIMGLRRTFVRNSRHPALKGISDELLKNWRGASTLTSPYLKNLPAYETHDPEWNWCGFTNTRVWRSGNTGNTASVLIEKPARGNWIPLIDGGFNLQFSPLLEYRDAKGVIVFCQMDVTGRTESEPAAERLCYNLVNYLDKATVDNQRKVYYTGNEKGTKLLKRLGVEFIPYNAQVLNDQSLLVVGPEAKLKGDLTEHVKSGGNAICLGLNAAEINELGINGIKVKDSTEFCKSIEDFSTPEFAGISNSELYWRTKLPLAAIQNTDKYSNKALKKIKSGKGTIILSQIAPWMLDYKKHKNLRNMFRRNVFLTSRLLANLGVAYKQTKLRATFNQKVSPNDYKLPQKWVALESPKGDGEDKGWHKSTFDDSSWKPIKVPGAFEDMRKELANYNGYFWYRITFTVPENMKGCEIILNAGRIDDESWIWLNDSYLGEITKKTNPKDHYHIERIYKLKPEQLKFGKKNTLVIKVADWFKRGGIMSAPKIMVPQASSNSYYLQEPIADDDPYRYYRW